MTILSKMKAHFIALMGATQPDAPPLAEELIECTHPSWTEESNTNDWRSHCKVCGLQAQGSCQ